MRITRRTPNDTGLRFTDVLFGFALREIVLRLVKFDDLTTATRIHLALAAVVILGSYIGFRNSQKRGKFKLRFFNLAVVRFALDQSMVFLYFWLALYFSTDRDPVTGELQLPSSEHLLQFDARTISAIFVLYLLWDLTSQWMARSGKYFTMKGGDQSPPTADTRLEAKPFRTVITAGGLAAAVAILAVSEFAEPRGDAATWWIGALILVAVAYRVLKDGLRDAST